MRLLTLACSAALAVGFAAQPRAETVAVTQLLSIPANGVANVRLVCPEDFEISGEAQTYTSRSPKGLAHSDLHFLDRRGNVAPQDDAGAQELIFIVGPLLTVLGISAFGATGNVLFAAALGLGGTVAFALNRVSRTVGASAISDLPRQSPLRSARFRRLVAFTFGIGVPVGVLTISVTVFGERHGIDGFAGWALAANAFGALVGATALALRPLKRAPQRMLAGCGLLLAVFYVPLALADLPPAAWLVLAVVAGVMLPPSLAQVFESVAHVAESTSLTEANAWVVSAMSVGVAAGTLGGGLVAGLELAVPVMVVGGSLVTALLALLVLPSTMAAAPTVELASRPAD